MKVTFNEPQEFFDELHKRPPNVQLVLRATVRMEPDRNIRPLTHTWVVATYLRVDYRGESQGPLPFFVSLVVELRHYVGQQYGAGDVANEQTLATRQRADTLLHALENHASALELEFCPGVYTPTEDKS